MSPGLHMDFPEKVVFVGGAPRSGTTVAHALICTAPGVSRYTPEISFFRPVVEAYRNGLAAWKGHTQAFFPDEAAFTGLMRETARTWLRRIWQAVGEPPILCVKDPLLTPLFPDLHRLLPGEAWFVTVCRHPYNVVRSRQEVHERGSGTPFGAAHVRAVADEYLKFYQTVLKADFKGRHLMFRYEELNTDLVRGNLAKFVGVSGFDPDAMWQGPGGETRDPAAFQGDPWDSPTYSKPIDLEPRLPLLASEWRKIVDASCAPIMERMQYR